MTQVRLAIVVPCYNEEAALPVTAQRLLDLLAELRSEGEVSEESAVYFVDDGSTDKTWSLIESLASASPYAHGLKLSHNKGHQNALLAGLFTAPGDVAISIDADLQDDPHAMHAMLKAYKGGADVVYGVRKRRDSDTAFKRTSATLYYRLLALMGVEVVFNHADYRLLSRRVIEALAQYEETNLFLRGIIPQLGFDHATVHYDRAERLAGETKYPLKQMLAFALQGVTSFSAAPLRAITVFGLMVSASSFASGAWVIWEKLVNDTVVPGWASILVPVFFLGGIQLLSLGVIGEYVAKIHLETKRRPRYFIDRQV